MVEILADGAVAARRQGAGGRGTDEGANLTVVEQSINTAIMSETRRGVLAHEELQGDYVLMRKVLKEAENEGWEGRGESIR